MKVMNVGFLQSVTYLEKLKADTQETPAPPHTSPKTSQAKHNDMVHIGDVFKSLIPPNPDNAILNYPSGDKNQAIADLEKRVSVLEHQISQLTKKIELLQLV